MSSKWQKYFLGDNEKKLQPHAIINNVSTLYVNSLSAIQ